MATKQISPAAAALQRARKLKGLTLAAAAESLSAYAEQTDRPGLSSSQLSRIETGTAYISQERLEQLADFYDLAVPELLQGDVMKAASRMDLVRLKAVVALVQQVVIDLRAKPSAEKMADAVTMIYERETDWAASNTDLDTQFDPSRHRGFIEIAFKK